MTKRARTRLWVMAGAGTLLLVILIVGALVTGSSSKSGTAAHATGTAAVSNPNLDPGTPLSGPAPDFTLTDQFGHRISLHSFRGHAVLLAFIDSQCTTICPLTTTAMVDAKRFLGAAGSQLQLLGVDANPHATTVADVHAYSRVHGLLHQWHFMTAAMPQLKQVWKSYGISIEIQHGLIDHTPALFLIDPNGVMRRVFMTQMNYASVPQQGQLLAHDIAGLLPGHPAVRSSLSYAQTPPISPRATTSLPLAAGGKVQLGPGKPRLLLFFASWDTEDFHDLGGQMNALNRYASAASGGKLPALMAVDEGSVEPSPGALPQFLKTLSQTPSYPVAIDGNGTVADGYQVQDLPWLVLVSSTGRILWYYDIGTQGWLNTGTLIARVRAALAHPVSTSTPSTSSTPSALAGSPAPLAALHRQASTLLGSGSGFTARLRGLRGYPIVVNAWASWCTPCQQEFKLFQAASLRYGKQVAFLGADTNDTAGNARAFLAKHHVSYPSYQTSNGQLSPLAVIEGLPTTIFINRTGKVVHVQTGQYDSQGALDADIATYALAG